MRKSERELKLAKGTLGSINAMATDHQKKIMAAHLKMSFLSLQSYLKGKIAKLQTAYDIIEEWEKIEREQLA